MTKEKEKKMLDKIFEKADLEQRIIKLSGPGARIALLRILDGDSIAEAVHYAEAPSEKW